MRLDHVLHFLGCWIIAAALAPFIGDGPAVTASIAIAILKEVVWDFFMERGDPDASDMLAGTAGAGMALFSWTGLVLIGLWVFWCGYVFTMGLYRAKLSGRLKGLSLVMASPFVVVAFMLDFIAQMTVFSVAFAELPRELLVTGRMRRLMAGPDGWRRRMADYLCKHLLDPFDPTGAHCDSEKPTLEGAQ